MSNILTIAYTTEGTTDQRFLHNIIRKTFEEAAFNCQGQIDVFEPFFIKFNKQDGFVNDVVRLAKTAFNNGGNVFCVHADADDENNLALFHDKIQPAINALQEIQSDEICKNLVPVIPVYMSEAWMLADLNLLKEEIGTDKSNEELNLTQYPESISNPKNTIENVLRIAQEHLPKRRNRLTISELYQPIGQKINIEILSHLPSFQAFKISVENALRVLIRVLNYIE